MYAECNPCETEVRLIKELLLEALERCHWNQTHAARHLSLTRRALKLKMDRLGLKRPDETSG